MVFPAILILSPLACIPYPAEALIILFSITELSPAETAAPTNIPVTVLFLMVAFAATAIP